MHPRRPGVGLPHHVASGPARFGACVRERQVVWGVGGEGGFVESAAEDAETVAKEIPRVVMSSYAR
ncbi:hypothetical protein GCM10027269_86070 [Kribbella endophytica]